MLSLFTFSRFAINYNCVFMILFSELIDLFGTLLLGLILFPSPKVRRGSFISCYHFNVHFPLYISPLFTAFWDLYNIIQKNILHLNCLSPIYIYLIVSNFQSSFSIQLMVLTTCLQFICGLYSSESSNLLFIPSIIGFCIPVITFFSSVVHIYIFNLSKISNFYSIIIFMNCLLKYLWSFLELFVIWFAYSA